MLASPFYCPGVDELDFWIGEWTCTDASDGSIGTNSISRVLSEKVVEERFHIVDAAGQELNGRSWSVHDPQRGWLQTWVDDQGTYLDFTGAATAEGFVFARDGQRMVFREVARDSFTWDWERRTNAGWQLIWRLEYERR
jgi:hypothetical protein